MVVNVAYSRVLFLGTAGVGKSSFKKSLLKRPWDPSASSTIISDVSCVRPFAKEWYAPKSEQWKEVTPDDDIEAMAHLFNKGETRSFIIQDLPADDATTTPINDHTKEQLDAILLEVCKLSLPQQSSTVDDQPHLLMHFWDCGGQPAFLEILPVFLTSRTIFLLHFDASKDLDSKWKSVYHSHGVQHDAEEEVGVSTLSYMLSWMANVHGHLMKTGEDGSVPEYPRMFCIGTHGDLLTDEKKEQVRSELVSHYQGKDYAKLISDTLIIDNTLSGKGESEDPNISKMRSAIIDITENKLIVKTPIGWVLFRKVLEDLNENIVSLSLAYDIGAACNIPPEDVPQVLSFYHELGAVLYYPQLSGLKDKIIVNPKFFVDALGKIFTFKGSAAYQGYGTESHILHKYGILRESLSTAVWSKCGGLKPDDFITVLLHFLLAAEVCIDNERICPSRYKQYFIPSILNLCHDDTAAVPHSKEMSSPLHITFGTSFVPPGFFTRFVAVIASHTNITLHVDEGVYRNKVTFRYEDVKGRSVEYLTVTDQHDVIQVNVYRVTSRPDPVPFTSVCQDILVLLDESAKEVERVLQNSVGRGFEELSELSKHFVSRSWDYVCDHCPASSKLHYLIPAKFQQSDLEITCEESRKYRSLTEKEKVWFPEEVIVIINQQSLISLFRY